jgi:hypothetical protein
MPTLPRSLMKMLFFQADAGGDAARRGGLGVLPDGGTVGDRAAVGVDQQAIGRAALAQVGAVRNQHFSALAHLERGAAGDADKALLREQLDAAGIGGVHGDAGGAADHAAADHKVEALAVVAEELRGRAPLDEDRRAGIAAIVERHVEYDAAVAGQAKQAVIALMAFAVGIERPWSVSTVSAPAAS